MKPWMAFGIALALVANSGRAQNPPSPAAGRPAPAAADAGERALRDRLDVYAKAYNARNAAGVADLFTDDATLVEEAAAMVLAYLGTPEGGDGS